MLMEEGLSSCVWRGGHCWEEWRRGKRRATFGTEDDGGNAEEDSKEAQLKSRGKEARASAAR